ncbi:MAG: HNH endonuclease [Candidatus Peribacteraceae bacterium]|nr:HNH endonuclease [Candidatus Peribacteraceae bacterium]
MIPTQIHTQHCGSTEDLECHHIYPRSYAHKVLKWNIYKVNDTTNGILVCRKHHSWLHKNANWRQYIKYFVHLAKRLCTAY